MLDRFNPHHAPAGSSTGGQFTSGNGGASSGGKSSGKLNEIGKVPRGGSDLRWKSEDTIKGSIVIEVPDDFDTASINDSDVKDFIKENLPGKVGSIESSGDVEDVKVIKLEKGKGYVRADLDITPTKEAGEHWLDTGDAAGQWSTYHGGRSMNTVQDIWERVKAAFAPAIETRAAYPWDQCIADQTKKYGSKKKAEKICGMIKAKYGGRVDTTDIFLPDGFDLEAALREIEAEIEEEPATDELTPDEIKLIQALKLAFDSGFVSIAPSPAETVENATHKYHTAKMEKCLKHLKEQGADPGKAHAICYAALGEAANRSMLIFPTQTRALTITRDAQGKYRWLGISASAVINKVGAIDSTTLFDNFIRHAQETGEYPVLDFFHEGERIRFGVADWLKRDGALYISSGIFDDTELGRGAAAGLEAQPDYWGQSIAYRVTEPPLMLISEGEIPVYMDGVNNFISIVPRRMAANLFTAALVAEEVTRMDAVAYQELVKLVGEERAKQFADQVDDANRTIADTGMVTRAEETKPAPEAPPVTQAEKPPTPEAPPAQTRQQDAQPLLDVPVVEQPTISDIVAKLNDISSKVAGLERALEMLQTDYGEMKAPSMRAIEEQKRAMDAIADLTTRLAGVEASKARWDMWLNDAPEYVKVEADKIYRARNQEPAPMTLAQIAEQSMSKMHRSPADRRGN